VVDSLCLRCQAPITEEFVFRGCILSLLLWSGVSPTKAILVAPVFFGFGTLDVSFAASLLVVCQPVAPPAHAHHGIRQVREGVSVNVAVLSTIVQFAYTTLFGIYVGYLFLRTGGQGSAVQILVQSSIIRFLMQEACGLSSLCIPSATPWAFQRFPGQTRTTPSTAFASVG
jgi:membrane protease YdiL (CAAX protease family)